MNEDSYDNPTQSVPTPASSAHLDPIPVGPFDLLEFIGKGAMGQVWLARHREQDVPAAVKVITHRGADTDHYRRHFQQELRAVARLHHPGVVMIFDYLEISREAEEASFGALNYGSPSLAMEYCAGGSLVGRLASLSWTEVRAILLSLLDSLAHAHARGVIHRDLKPGNILLTDRSGGGVRLTDFGLALLTERLDGKNSANRGVCGTPAFMSPEQLHAGWRNVGPWSDLYSLGCLAYQLVCGRPPFDGHSIVEIARKHIHKPVPRLEPRIPVPDRFEAWIHRLLQKSPLDRYRRAGDAAWGLMLMEQPPDDEGPADSPIVSNARASSLVLKPLLDLAGEHRPSHKPSSRAERGEAEADLADGPREDSGDTPEVDPHAIICPPLTRDWRHMVHRRPSIKLLGAGRGLYGLRYIPLIGRETEREFLWERIRQVELTASPRAAVLQGGAGCGKSYLAEWFCDRATENGAVITFKATHNSSPGGAEGLSRMLARRIRTAGLQRAQVLERVRSWFEADGIDDPYVWDALTEILSPATPEDVEAGQRKIQFSRPEQRYAIILRTLKHIAQGRMMALWLDDVQWSPESIGFARYCLEQNEAESAPILIIATIRSEAVAERPAESKQLVELLELDNADRCWVEPLPADEHLELVGELLHLEPALARQVADRTAGNPLFAVQLIGDWVDRGVLEVGSKGFVLQDGERPRIPDDLYSVWSTRLDDVLEGADDDELFAFELAAALGQEVDLEDWRLCCELADVDFPDEQLHDFLMQRLFVDTDSGVRFVHGLLRECLARRSREAARWTRANFVAAQMLLDHRDQTDESAERLGRYLFAAGRLEEALDPLLRAARYRGNRHERATAMTLLDLRYEALDRLGHPEESPARLESHLMRIIALAHLQHLDDAGALADSTIEKARAVGDAQLLAAALLRRAEVEEFQGRYDRAWDRLEAIEAHQGHIDASWNARIRHKRGFILMRRAHFDEAIVEFEQSVALSEQAQDPERLAFALADLGECEFRRGNSTVGKRHLEAATRLYEQRGRPLGAARTMITLGDIIRHEGELREAEALYRQVYKKSRNAAPRIALLARLNLAMVRVQLGEYERVFDELKACEQAYRARGNVVMLAFARCLLLPCLAHRSEWQRLVEMLGFVEDTTEEMSVHDLDLAACAELAGELAAEGGNTEIARRVYEFARRQWSGLGRDGKARAVEKKLDEFEL